MLKTRRVGGSVVVTAETEGIGITPEGNRFQGVDTGLRLLEMTEAASLPLVGFPVRIAVGKTLRKVAEKAELLLAGMVFSPEKEVDVDVLFMAGEVACQTGDFPFKKGPARRDLDILRNTPERVVR